MWVGYLRIQSHNLQEQRLRKITDTSFQLLVLTNDLYNHPSRERVREQWEKKHRELSLLVKVDAPMTPRETAILDRMSNRCHSLQTLYSKLTDMLPLTPIQENEQKWKSGQRDRVIAAMSLKAQGISSDVTAFEQFSNQRLLQDQHIIMGAAGLISVASIGVLGLLSVMIGRSILHPLDQLRQGTKILANGQLDYRMDLNSEDEFGELSHSVDTMTDELRTMVNAIRRNEKDLKEKADNLLMARKAMMSLKEDADIARARTETALNESRKLAGELGAEKIRAEAANHAKSEFLANMSHEIRTPMNAVLGFTEILKGMESDPKKCRYIDNIHTSGNALLKLINDILDLSKIEANKLELQYSAVSLSSFLAEFQTLFSIKIRDKGLDFIVETSRDIPQALVLDETRVRQVLINLLGNSLKFTDSGAISLRASTTERRRGSCVDLTIEVADSGSGIPKDQQEQIFGAFEQTKGQKAEKFGGTGLGLAITRRLIELMGGTITVDSEVGKGTRFKILLPDVEVAAIKALAARKTTAFDFQAISFLPATILIADDIDFNREMLLTYLTDWDFRLLEAENGLEAIDAARKHHPDLILLDMKMPEMDGYEASRILNDDEELNKIPVVAVTASALKQDEERISRICNGYLRKPISKTDLLREVMRFLPHSVAAQQTVEVEKRGTEDRASPDGLAEQFSRIPEEWLKKSLKMAESSLIDDLEIHLDEIRNDYPAVATAIHNHLTTFRFDLIVKLLQSEDNTDRV